jgi:hypothetical protein
MLGSSAATSPADAAGIGNRLSVVFLVTDYFPCAQQSGLRRSRPHHDSGCHSCRDRNADMTLVHTTIHILTSPLLFAARSAPVFLAAEAEASPAKRRMISHTRSEGRWA